MTEREFIPESTREAFVEALANSEDFAVDMDPATRRTKARELVGDFMDRCAIDRANPDRRERG